MSLFEITKKTLLKALIVVMATTSFPLFADDVTPPDEVVKNTLEAALVELRENKEEFAKDSNKLHDAIEDTLGSAVNFELLSKAVLGVHWGKASESQRKAFITEFRELIIGTYSAAVFDYDGESFNYLPFSNPENKDRVKVKTELVASDGSVIPITFSMNIRGDTQWKVYNIKIEASEATIEFIPLYRSDFRERVSSQGLDALIEELRSKNKQ